jgi:hypothetical protein
MLSIEELQKQIKVELKVDKNHLDLAATENVLFIQKYINMFLLESIEMNKLQTEYDSLYKDKALYYKLEYKYVPENQKELFILIDGDEKIIELKKKISLYSSLIKFISDTIQNFRDRGWGIKSAIEFRKFLAGE